MRPIAIVPRPGRAVGKELNDSITYLVRLGICPRNAVTGESFALLWVDDENIGNSVVVLRNAGFEAAVLIETDVAN